MFEITCSSMVFMKLVVELSQSFEHFCHPFSWVNQVCDSEVVSSVLLSKATAWNSHDARFVHHFKTVQEIW